MNTDTQEAVAVKIINLEKTSAAAENVRKEVNNSSGLLQQNSEEIAFLVTNC